MAGLYVPLDVNYFDDDKIVEAGPMAELLFVRSLAFAKRIGKNGHISDGQLTSVGARIPRHRMLADRLYDLGLWERNGAGLFVAAWLKRNPLVEEVAAKKSDAGTLGNHVRWHQPPAGKPSIECEHCRREGIA